MSIIFDALKRVQKKSGTPQTALPSSSPGTKPGFQFRPKMILLYLLVAAFGFFIGKILYDFVLPKSKKPLLSKAAPLSMPKAENISQAQATGQQAAGPREKTPSAPAEEPRPFKKDAKSSLVVNGIFFSKEEGYCLINNRIAKVGDTVEGATIKRINPDSVEAEIGGHTIKLRAPSK